MLASDYVCDANDSNGHLLRHHVLGTVGTYAHRRGDRTPEKLYDFQTKGRENGNCTWALRNALTTLPSNKFTVAARTLTYDWLTPFYRDIHRVTQHATLLNFDPLYHTSPYFHQYAVETFGITIACRSRKGIPMWSKFKTSHVLILQRDVLWKLSSQVIIFTVTLKCQQSYLQNHKFTYMIEGAYLCVNQGEYKFTTILFHFFLEFIWFEHGHLKLILDWSFFRKKIVKPVT